MSPFWLGIVIGVAAAIVVLVLVVIARAVYLRVKQEQVEKTGIRETVMLIGKEVNYTFWLTRGQIMPGSVGLATCVSNEAFKDDGYGRIRGNLGSKCILNYATGEGEVTFASPPSSLDISVSYLPDERFSRFHQLEEEMKAEKHKTKTNRP